MQLPAAGFGAPFLGVLTGLAVVVGYVAVGYWLYVDARTRGSERPRAWAVNWVLFSVVAVGYYLLVRNRIGERAAPATTREQSVKAVAMGVVVSLLAASASTPPDPFSQIRVFLPSLLVTLPLAYALVVGVSRVRDRPNALD